MESIFSAVKSIIIFLILITVIMNLLGKSSFKQYIGIFTGMVLILIVIRPIMQWINVDGRMNFYFDQNQYKINMDEISRELYAAQDGQKQKVLEEYKSTLKTQINGVLSDNNLVMKQCEIQVDEDVNSDTCGALQTVKIVAANQTEETVQASTTNKQQVNQVDQVTIDKIKINEKVIDANEQEEEDPLDTITELTVKKSVADLFGMNLEAISVEIKE